MASQRKLWLEERDRPITFKEFGWMAFGAGVLALDLGGGVWRLCGKLVLDYHPFHKKGPWVRVHGARAKWIRRSPERAIALASGQEWLPLMHRKRRSRRIGGGRKKRIRAYRAALGRCRICEEMVAPLEASLEHLVPLARGGLNVPCNYGMSHRRCNQERGADPLP